MSTNVQTTESRKVQTRSDGPGGKYLGLRFFATVGEAFGAAQEDPNIWKISWDKHRFIRKTEEWSPECEAKIATLLQGHFIHSGVEYSYTPPEYPDRQWWVDQVIFPKELLKRRYETKEISQEEFERLAPSESIVEVLASDLFPLRYCTRQ